MSTTKPLKANGGDFVIAAEVRTAESDTYLTTAEAAQLVRLSPRTLERLRLQGSGPRYLKAGRGKKARVLYRRTDLVAWLEQSEFKSTSEY
jgi:transcriptional regulator GlxA family with amidase domain